MKIAYFKGCKIPFHLSGYGTSFEAVMGKLGVELVPLDFSCCGNPYRSDSFEASMFSSIKNYALARQHDLDIITPCKCCFGQFKHAAYWYWKKDDLKKKMDSLLTEEDLFWDGKTQVKHYLTFLHQDFGIEKLAARIEKKLPEKKTAVQYGCHALRPFSITGFDNPYTPRIFEDLVNVTGLEAIEWSRSTECCGNPVLNHNENLSKKLIENKLKTARNEGANLICTACTHCQIQYETIKTQNDITQYDLSSHVFTQLLGLALGIPRQKLSMSRSLPFE